MGARSTIRCAKSDIWENFITSVRVPVLRFVSRGSPGNHVHPEFRGLREQKILLRELAAIGSGQSSPGPMTMSSHRPAALPLAWALCLSRALLETTPFSFTRGAPVKVGQSLIE